MRYKPDWDEAEAHWTALWEGRNSDRPCLCVVAPAGERISPPARPPESWRQWFDPEWVLSSVRAALANTYWGGEAIPSHLLMGGWAFCYGAKLTCHPTTIWHDPIPVDFDAPPNFSVEWDDPWIQRYMEVYQAVLDEAGWDNFLIGKPCILPGNGLLAGILGGERFLTALFDHPEWMREAILQIARGQVAVRRRFADLVKPRHRFWYGNAGWMPFWAPEAYFSTQSDVSCMLSPDMYAEFILPELALYIREFGALWYHLDGSRALQHLPALLALPGLRVIQFTTEPDVPPNGPAWLDFYQQVQQAGKIVHISLPAENIEPLVRQLDPALLCLDTWRPTPAEADALLADARRWTR
ncbi:MAG: uroporphyrinogen decarboxylase/cobalamine-independent methonine synthase family protein [Armatimonadota bacterium]